MGMSLNTYLEAAHNVGMAPFDPRELIAVTDLDAHDPNEVMIVTTGSQVKAGPLTVCAAFMAVQRGQRTCPVAGKPSQVCYTIQGASQAYSSHAT